MKKNRNKTNNHNNMHISIISSIIDVVDNLLSNIYFCHNIISEILDKKKAIDIFNAVQIHVRFVRFESGEIGKCPFYRWKIDGFGTMWLGFDIGREGEWKSNLKAKQIQNIHSTIGISISQWIHEMTESASFLWYRKWFFLSASHPTIIPTDLHICNLFYFRTNAINLYIYYKWVTKLMAYTWIKHVTVIQ